MWNFETDAAYEEELSWVDEFVRTHVEPLDAVLGDPFDRSDPRAQVLLAHLRQEVKMRGLWACHLGPELGGQGFGQVKLALLNEIIGRSRWAPSAFGCQAPDSGNAETLAHYGTEEQKASYLQPLLDGDISSCYSMTEPQAGADPALFTTRAVRDGDSYVLNGEKWFSSNARHSSFFLVLAVTDPAADPLRRLSMFIVPAEAPGIEIVRDSHVVNELIDHHGHAYVRYSDVRVPADHLLGEEGDAFVIAQTRLSGGRVHHAMRTVAHLHKAFDMLAEQAVSRRTRSGTLADLQLTQAAIADSWLEIEQFRLLVLRTAWLIDRHQDYRKVRKDIAAVKVAMPRVYASVVQRAMHLHGALGVSNEMPFWTMMAGAASMGIADGPTEVHQVTLAKQLLRGFEPRETLFPTEHLPSRHADAETYLAARLSDLGFVG